MSSRSRATTILVVGDVHRHWRSEDLAFLQSGPQDLVLFVGDLGDEDTGLVRQIAGLRAEKAVLLGNHDAWQSFSRRRPTRNLRDSLEALAEDHLAYGVRELLPAGLSVIGARPFSWGGRSLRSTEIYRRLYGVDSIETSAHKIAEAARKALHRDLIVLAHNGPSGLGVTPTDIWGKDFGPNPGGDWGDPDLEIAIHRIEERGLRVRAVVAGHMHHRLVRPRGAERVRFVRKGSTLYINAAVVPRIRKLEDGRSLAHYLRLTCRQGEVEDLDEIWVDETGEIREVVRPEVIDLGG